MRKRQKPNVRPWNVLSIVVRAICAFKRSVGTMFRIDAVIYCYTNVDTNEWCFSFFNFFLGEAKTPPSQ